MAGTIAAGGVLLKGIRRRKQDPFYELSRVASATECTGLMPSLPQSEEEDENYASLYATHDQPPE
jgi:hypothetical protein